MLIAILLTTLSLEITQARGLEYCTGSYSFEKTTRVALPESYYLFSELNFVQDSESGIWGYECQVLCMATTNCGGFYVDHTKGTCRLLPIMPNSHNRSFPLYRGSYFEKICLRGRSKCSKQWAFERVTGMELVGHNDKVVTNVSKDECRSICLEETQFTCRSLEYEYDGNVCTLSRYDRRSQSKHFQPSQRNIDYLENQCIAGPSKCAFERKNGTSTYFWMAYMKGPKVDHDTCQYQCNHNREFTCRSFVIDFAHNACFLSSDDRNSLQPSDYIATNFSNYYEKSSCVDVTMRCGLSTMTVILTVEPPFHGRIYSMVAPDRCVSKAADIPNEVTLTMPLDSASCGTKNMGNGTFVNSIIVQRHPFILRSTDKRIDVACDYEEHKLQLKAGKEISEEEVNNITSVVTGVAPTPDAKLTIVDINGKQVNGVELGTQLFLRVQLVDESIFGVMGTQLIARSGDGSESMVLVNDKGCPTELELFSGLTKLAGTKILQGGFNAFRFASDGVVHFQITISFCLDSCKPVSCEDNDGEPIESYGRRRRSTNESGDIVSNRKIEGTIHITSKLERKDINGNLLYLNYHQKLLLPQMCTSHEVLLALSLALGTVQVAIICACVMLTCTKRLSNISCFNHS